LWVHAFPVEVGHEAFPSIQTLRSSRDRKEVVNKACIGKGPKIEDTGDGSEIPNNHLGCKQKIMG